MSGAGREPAWARSGPEARLEKPERMLLIDTCGAEGSLALAERGDAWRIMAAERLPGRSASELLLPAIRSALAQAGWRIAQLAAVAVVHGPGSFTGLRVGGSAAKGLAEGGDVPLLAISRLEVLADAEVARNGRAHALLDAGRQEVYHGDFGPGSVQREELTTVATMLEAIRTKPGEFGAVLVCEAKLQAAFYGRGVHCVREPTAADALRIAAERLEARIFADPATLDGNYLRRTETEIRERVEAHERARSGTAVL